jgi:hypothetical protein
MPPNTLRPEKAASMGAKLELCRGAAARGGQPRIVKNRVYTVNMLTRRLTG